MVLDICSMQANCKLRKSQVAASKKLFFGEEIFHIFHFLTSLPSGPTIASILTHMTATDATKRQAIVSSVMPSYDLAGLPVEWLRIKTPPTGVPTREAMPRTM